MTDIKNIGILQKQVHCSEFEGGLKIISNHIIYKRRADARTYIYYRNLWSRWNYCVSATPQGAIKQGYHVSLLCEYIGTRNIAWFVGFSESGNENEYFEIYLSDNTQEENIFASTAKEIALKIIE